MPDKKPEGKYSLLEVIQKLWLPVAGFLGAITLLYNFYKLWLGDQTTVTYFLIGGGLLALVIALGLVALGSYTTRRPAVWPIGATITETHFYFSPSGRKAAAIGLGAIVLLAAIGAFFLAQHREAQKEYMAEQEKKFIVVIASLEGPEDIYGLRNEMIESLNADFSDEKNIEIISVDETVTLTQGSEYARQLGEDQLADIVIWGWYRPTENPNVTIHIEVLFQNNIMGFDDSMTRRPSVSIHDLESFEFQQKIGRESNTLILFLLGLVSQEAGDNSLAISYLDRALGQISDDILSNKAVILFHRGRLEPDDQKALMYLDQAIQTDPTIAGAYVTRGMIYFNLEQYDLAVSNYDKTLEVDPQATYVFFMRGFAYDRLEKYDLAIADYNRAIEISPTVSLFYSFRGDVHRSLEHYESALADFTKAIELKPQDARGYQGRGSVYHSLKQYDNAIANYSRALEVAPEDAQTYSLRGSAFIDLKQYENALMDFSMAISIDPSNHKYYLYRGTTYNYLGRNDEALTDLDRGIEMLPTDSTGYYLRGLTYASMNMYDSAIRDFTKAIQILPDFPDAYNARGVTYLTGEVNLAVPDFTRAIELDEDNPMYYQNRHTAYALMGKTEEANADLLKYKELTERNEP